MCLNGNLEKTCKTFILFHLSVQFTSKTSRTTSNMRQHPVGGTFSEEFGTVVAQGEVVGPLRIPAFAGGCGSAALAAHTLGADLERKERNAVEFLIVSVSSDLQKSQISRVDFSPGTAFSNNKAKVIVALTSSSKDIPNGSHPSPAAGQSLWNT